MISELIGKTVTEIIKGKNNDEITFTCSDGDVYKMYHSQDCCESVAIEDIIGDLDDLIGSPILKATEDTSNEDTVPEHALKLMKPDHIAKLVAMRLHDVERDESHTWTFYNIATIKGYVTIRWYGSSNGYYSETVDFEKINS